MSDQIKRFRLAATRPKIRAVITRHSQDVGAIAFHSVEAVKLFLDQIPYKANEKVEFRNQDFSGADMSGVDFQMCFFRECDFTRANLSNADFTGCLLYACDFTEADLTVANFEMADISDSIFTDADVTGADLGMTYGQMAEPPKRQARRQPGFCRHLRPW